MQRDQHQPVFRQRLLVKTLAAFFVAAVPAAGWATCTSSGSAPTIINCSGGSDTTVQSFPDLGGIMATLNGWTTNIDGRFASINTAGTGDLDVTLSGSSRIVKTTTSYNAALQLLTDIGNINVVGTFDEISSAAGFPTLFIRTTSGNIDLNLEGDITNSFTGASSYGHGLQVYSETGVVNVTYKGTAQGSGNVARPLSIAAGNDGFSSGPFDAQFNVTVKEGSWLNAAPPVNNLSGDGGAISGGLSHQVTIEGTSETSRAKLTGGRFGFSIQSGPEASSSGLISTLVNAGEITGGMQTVDRPGLNTVGHWTGVATTNFAATQAIVNNKSSGLIRSMQGVGVSLDDRGFKTATINNEGTIRNDGFPGAVYPAIRVANATAGYASNNTINNLSGGQIDSIGDMAFDSSTATVAGTTVTINNQAGGKIVGYVKGTGSATSYTVTNAGIWYLRNLYPSTANITIRTTQGVAASNFGTGGGNTITNTGTFALASTAVSGPDPLVTGNGTTSTIALSGAPTGAPYLPTTNNAMVLGGATQAHLLGVNTFTNTGTIDLSANPAVGDVLVISSANNASTAGTGEFVAGGFLKLDTVLNEGGTNSQSDVLVLDTLDAGNGQLRISINNVQPGQGQQTTGDGILLVEVRGAASIPANKFALAGLVTDSGYQYVLRTVGNKLYLQSSVFSPGSGAAIPATSGWRLGLLMVLVPAVAMAVRRRKGA